MGFIDIENVDENSICDTKYKIKNLMIKPNNTEMHSIYIEVEIEISSFVYESKNINLIEDLYSMSSKVEFKQKSIMMQAERVNVNDICKINEQIDLPEMNNNRLFDVKVKPIINGTKIQSNKIMYDGNLNLNILFELNSSIGMKEMAIPFSFEMQSNEIENNNIETNIEIKSENFIVNSNEKIDANIELEFNAQILKEGKINLIDEISCEECGTEDIYSMVIYFVKPGDTMWKIAKKFKTSIEDIVKLNNIEDINNINSNTQLYIPKHINKNIAV